MHTQKPFQVHHGRIVLTAELQALMHVNAPLIMHSIVHAQVHIHMHTVMHSIIHANMHLNRG
jgi:hypothetical protein